MTGSEFEAIYLKYQPHWLNLAERILKNHTLAEDVVQEVVINKVLKNLDKLTPTNMDSYVRQGIIWHIKAFIWFAGVPEHFLVDERRAVEQPIRLDEIEGTKDDVYRPEVIEEVETKTPLELSIREALGKLSDFENDVVCLKVFGDLSFREIAEILQSTREAVKKTYQRVIPKLQLTLGSVGISSPASGDNTSVSISDTAA